MFQRRSATRSVSCSILPPLISRWCRCIKKTNGPTNSRAIKSSAGLHVIKDKINGEHITCAVWNKRLNYTRRASELLALTILDPETGFARNALTALVVNVNFFLALQKYEQSWVTKAFVLVGQILKCLTNDRVIARMLVVIKSGSRQAQNTASARRGYLILASHVSRRHTLQFGPYLFLLHVLQDLVVEA